MGQCKVFRFFRGGTSHQEGEGSGGQSQVQRKQMKMEQGKEMHLPLEGVSQLPEEEGVRSDAGDFMGLLAGT